MNISKFKVLLTAVDMGSFSAAAQKLGYTQSGLTHMMNALEDELGVSVLQRGHYGIKLTPVGERIIPTIRNLVTCEDALYNEIELVKSYGDNIIRIGAFSSMASTWLPPIVEKFNSEFPDVTVNIQTGTVSELYGGLLDGRFDICFGTKNPRYDFKWTNLATDRFFAILPPDYPSTSEFPLSGFNGTKFLMPGLGFDDDISAVFSANNVKPFVTPTYVDDPAIISMVEHSLGVSMLSELILMSRKGDNVLTVPIVPEVSRTLAVAVKSDKVLTLPLKRLIAITKDFAKEARREFFGKNE